MHDLRRFVATTVIVSFSIAALMGIVALLAGGDFGETEGHILLTTVITGVASVAMLCYLAAADHRFAIIATLGAIASLVALVTALMLTWDDAASNAVVNTFTVSFTVAASCAQACLLLAWAGRARASALLAVTLIAITVVAGMVIVAVLRQARTPDGYWRVLGVIAILDALGTVSLAAVRAFGHHRQAESPAPGQAADLTAEVSARVDELARQRGVSCSALVDGALDALLVIEGSGQPQRGA